MLKAFSSRDKKLIEITEYEAIFIKGIGEVFPILDLIIY